MPPALFDMEGIVMIRIATGTQMREVDRTAIQERGIAGLTLMEEAGKALAAEICKEAEKSVFREVILLCGGGNNGGDGYVAARLLGEKKIPVKVFSLTDPEKLTGDAGINYKRYREQDNKIIWIQSKSDLALLRNSMDFSDVLVDAIFGTGLSRPVSGLAAEVIRLINLWRDEEVPHRKKTVISADIPSGVGADDGNVLGCAVRADKTVTFQCNKVGMLVEPGKSFSGEVTVFDIGIPEEVCEAKASEFFQIDAREAGKQIRKRPRQMNKGDAGKLLLVAGSKGMAGAAVLAAQGALRSGAGLVKVCACGEVVQVLQCAVPEATCLILGEDVHTNIEAIMEETKNFDAVACGPGLGKSEESRLLVEHMIKNTEKPMVLDADGINAAAADPNLLKEAKAPLILTPHPGEMGRLTGKSAKEVNEDRIGIAKSFSSEYNVTLILKGADSLIAVPEGRMYINGTGNPGMATGGSGDVLTGVVGAFLASGMKAEKAASLGAYIHGLAGDYEAETIGEYGMLASDIAMALAYAIKLTAGEHRRGI